MKQARIICADGRALLERCGVAENAKERMTGLLSHRSLAADEGLWFPHETSIHTFFMRFPIDVAFLDRRGRVIALYPALPAWRHTWIHLLALGGGALETRAGLFADAGVKKGEVLRVCHTS